MLSIEQKTLEGVPLIHVTQRTKDPGWVSFEEWGWEFGLDRQHLSHGMRFTKTGSGLQAAIAGQGLVLCGLVESFGALKKGQLILPFGPAVGYKTEYCYRIVWVPPDQQDQDRDRFADWLIAKSEDTVREMQRYLAQC